MKFTKKETSLCKQVAEKYRKELVHGDWYISYDGVIKLKALHQKGYRHEECIPLWTISDCLEFLNQRDSHCVLLGWSGKTKRSKRYCHVYIANNIHEGEGYTYLEALLKVVLAVLGEK